MPLLSEPMNRPSLSEALSRADLIHDLPVLDAAIQRMAAEIDQEIQGEHAVFITVMHGGLPFAAKLALAMKSDMEFDYIHATRYRGATSGSELHWLRQPAAALAGRTVVLATHAALPDGAVHRRHVLRDGTLHDMSSQAAILA